MEKAPKKFVLTPVITTSKIPILAIISGYCYKKIPQRCIPPILSILVEMIENEPDKNGSSDAEYDIVQKFFPSLPEIMELVDSSIRSFFSSSSPVKEKDTVERDIKSIHYYLLQQMWQLKSYDDFFTFLLSSANLLIDPSSQLIGSVRGLPNKNKPKKSLYCSSFLGSFISVIALGVTTLTFEEGIQIWKGFLLYRKETESLWSVLNGIDSTLEFNNASSYSTYLMFEKEILPNASIGIEESRSLVYSHMDLASLFQSQVSTLQRKSSSLPKSLTDLLSSLSQSDRSLIPSSYHVEHLNSWRQADYDKSFDSLHRYFDYMMSNRRQYFYHYALLALATLHGSFGANKEALRAIDEAILVARENKDLDCLNYLLTWLLNFIISKPQHFVKLKDHPSRSEIMDFLRLKTKETKNLSLQSISFQFEVVVSLLEGSSLTVVMENMVKTFYLILNFEDTDELKGIFITACQVADTIWKRVGYPSIGNLYLETAIDFAKEKNNEFDLILLYIRKSNDLYFIGEIDESFQLLSSVEDSALKDLSMSKKWKMGHDVILFYHYLNQCKYPQCDILMDNMMALAEGLDDQEVTNELIYQRAIYSLKTNNITEGISIITKQLTSMKENSLVYNNHWFIRFQVLLSHIFTNYTPYPERGISILLSAANRAHDCSLIFNLCECIICLCNLLLKVDPILSIPDVKDLLSEFLPKILEIKRADMIADAYHILSLVEFIEFEQTRENLTSDEFNAKIAIVLKYLNISMNGYERMFDYVHLRKTLNFEKKVAQTCFLHDLVMKNASKIREVDLAIQKELNDPIL
ncbi:hypothetical protein PMKS-002303 [Pichia membranifaciens]|uniref:Anaphase-promoting complex subunit 5 n=1 Tax=Pichia membranifaciens TaxID=4926 RepID=A0A1Q2YGX5_9ASCO|nr:hypothetical protein PMKS-002303 [Pichia membranifaciens]